LKNLIVTLDRAGEFDEIIDVRTPLEFAEDHIPGALNAPVLSNEERVIVGTMYRQVSPYEATRVGAAMVARNIARHLDTTFADRPRNWRPLIYCWRGGKRSGSMTAWFNLIGWQARQLDGGYKAYRRSVCATLDTLPAQFRYITLVGHTGCGKTRLLNALRAEGAQTLDLEALARHRGSLLGALPGVPQPTQKALTGAGRDARTFRPRVAGVRRVRKPQDRAGATAARLARCVPCGAVGAGRGRARRAHRVPARRLCASVRRPRRVQGATRAADRAAQPRRGRALERADRRRCARRPVPRADRPALRSCLCAHLSFVVRQTEPRADVHVPAERSGRAIRRALLDALAQAGLPASPAGDAAARADTNTDTHNNATTPTR
jgi:tRNA 2-selenouridine synthase